MQHGVCFEIPLYNFVIIVKRFMINYAGVILYAAEAATQVALDAIQCLGKCFKCLICRVHVRACVWIRACIDLCGQCHNIQCTHVIMQTYLFSMWIGGKIVIVMHTLHM